MKDVRKLGANLVDALRILAMNNSIVKQCKWCLNFFESAPSRSYGSHVGNCLLNPRVLEKHRKNGLKSKENADIQPFEKTCEICGTNFTVYLSRKRRESKIYNGKRCCSRTCANKIHPKRSVESLKKTSDSLRAHYKMHSRQIRHYTHKCVICGISFSNRSSKSMTCSKLCLTTLSSERACQRIINDQTSSRLKTIRCTYNFNCIPIRCDSKVEYACLNFIELNYDVLSITRCNFYIPYVSYDGSTRRYVPDFMITLHDHSQMIVEAKCELSSNKLQRKWSDYYQSVPYKRIALEKFCYENGYAYLFFQKNMHSKFYNSLNRKNLPP